jgi:hypothetical protein
MTTLIPSLFPFFVLTNLVTGALSGQTLFVLRPIAAACKIPPGAESLLATGLLGGYPVGAQSVALLHHRRQLSDAQASRMLPFCNNAGPAFIFGVLGSLFSNRWIPWLLWGLHITSAVLVGLLLPECKTENHVQMTPKIVRVTDAISQSLKSMSLVCGWVVLMRIVLEFIDKWFLWLFPLPVEVILSGILELSNGCIRLVTVENEGLRFLIAAGLLSQGGVCVTLQTFSAAEKISMHLYLPGKILQCCISIFLSYYCQFAYFFANSYRCKSLPIAALAIIVIITAFLHVSEKKSGIPAMNGV